MDSYNLKTASSYINNLLLARGLLRNGKPIEFAHPSKGEGGKEATMAQIINLVHDLTLKRDRDQEQRESLAQTLRNLREEAAQQAKRIESLENHNADLARKLSLIQSQERSAKMAQKTAELSAQKLKGEMTRLKATVQQVRTSCATDVRKRDKEIQRLKTHLSAQQRGNKTGLVGASITITPGSTGMGGVGHVPRDDDSPDMDDPGYSLKQETNEFLTELSKGLSDENDNLIGLVRSTLSTLKELQGLPENERVEGQYADVDENDEEHNADMLQALPTSYESLATDMDNVLESLRSLLTNPNFVPIEEVEIREQQIIKLRSGWETMENRWKEAVSLMEGWRKRLMNGGDTINLEELKMGLGLGVGIPTISGDEELSALLEEDEESEVSDAEEGEDESAPQESFSGPEEEMEAAEEQPAAAARTETSNRLFNIKLPHKPSLQQLPLVEGSGSNRSPRKVAFVSPAHSAMNTPPRATADENGSEVDLIQNETTDDSPSKNATVKLTIPKVSESRIPRQTRRQNSPTRSPSRPSSKLTVQEKLHLAQAEAEAAKMAEGLKANNASPKRPAESRIKKARAGGRPRRRKSTLTAEELETLMFTK